MLAPERVEHDDVVDAVDELRPEMLPDDLEHGLLHGVVVLLARHSWITCEPRFEVMIDDRVAEVDRPALPVGQAAVVEHLEQHVEHVGMRLLDLVEQDHGVRPAANASVR